MEIILEVKPRVPAKAKATGNSREGDDNRGGECDRIAASPDSILALEQAGPIISEGLPAADFAHELNNLLTVILGHTEYLLGHEESPGIFRLRVEEIRNAAARGLWLTNRILASAGLQ